MSELVAVSEGEGGSDDGPEDGKDIRGDMDVRLEDWNSRIIHGIEQSGQPVPYREYGECIPEQFVVKNSKKQNMSFYLIMDGTWSMT